MKLLFIGNRRFVLEEILKNSSINASVAVIKDSHLQRDFKRNVIPCNYTQISSKKDLIQIISSEKFDVVLANGCPYRLPISKLPSSVYVNIHQSYLPDLRGYDPIIGAMLYEKNGGATCHVMSDLIDEGEIICQVSIPFTSDLDVSLLYQLSFIAEKQVFNEAYALNFEPSIKQLLKGDETSYKRKLIDRSILFNEDNNQIINKTRAFSNKSLGCWFIYEKGLYRFYEASIVSNPYLINYASKFSNLQIIFVYEDCVLFKKDGCIIKFTRIQDSLEKVKVGSFFTTLKLSDYEIKIEQPS